MADENQNSQSDQNQSDGGTQTNPTTQDTGSGAHPQTGSTSGGTTTKKTFNIPQEVLEKYADLVALIKGSSSMNDDERQYWFSILPIMTQEQVKRLRNILDTEKQKLAAIDSKYQNQLDQINEKHLLEWQEMKRREKRDELASKEGEARMSDEAEAESLLEDDLSSVS